MIMNKSKNDILGSGAGRKNTSGYSTKLFNALSKNGIKTDSETLSGCIASDLREIPGIGTKSLIEIATRLLHEKKINSINAWVNRFRYKKGECVVKKETGITQTELARELEIKKCTLNRLLSGKGNVRKNKARIMSKISGIDMIVFMAGEPKEVRAALEEVYGDINFTLGRPVK